MADDEKFDLSEIDEVIPADEVTEAKPAFNPLGAFGGFKQGFDAVAAFAQDAADKAGDALGDAREAFDDKFGDKIVDAKDALGDRVDDAKEAIGDMLEKKPDELEVATADYNAANTSFNDAGMSLFIERVRAVDLLTSIEYLVNSIAATPKEFEAQFGEINANKQEFKSAVDFADQELKIAKASAGGAGAGVAAGAAVASLAPTAAMWVATTFGTASTGAAISALSGAAATNAALAWLGGGALAAGGGGMLAGNALLALAGPVGWGIAGVSILASVALLAKNKIKSITERNETIASIKRNTEQVIEGTALLGDLKDRTTVLRENLQTRYEQSLKFFESDYTTLNVDERSTLGALVNSTLALSALLSEKISVGVEEEGDEQ